MSETEEDPTASLPTPEEILASADFDDEHSDEYQSRLEYRFSEVSPRSEMDWAHLKGLQDHYLHKGNWSTFLMVVMTGMVAFQCLLLMMVGFGWWDFSKYDWLLPALLVQNLGQVIALAFVVVRSLFRDQGFLAQNK